MTDMEFNLICVFWIINTGILSIDNLDSSSIKYYFENITGNITKGVVNNGGDKSDPESEKKLYYGDDINW